MELVSLHRQALVTGFQHFSGDSNALGQTSLENLVQIMLVMVEVELLVQASATSVARAVVVDME